MLPWGTVTTASPRSVPSSRPGVPEGPDTCPKLSRCAQRPLHSPATPGSGSWPLWPRPRLSPATALFPDGPRPRGGRRPAVLRHALHARAQLLEGGVCHLTPATLVMLDGRTAVGGKPERRRQPPPWAPPAETPGAGPPGRPSPALCLPLTLPGVKQLQPPGPLPPRPGLACHPSPLCPRARRSCRTRTGRSPAAREPLLHRPPLFPGCGGGGRSPALLRDRGGWGARALAQPLWARRSEVPRSATPRWLSPQTGLQCGLPPPSRPRAHSSFLRPTPTRCPLVPPHGRPGTGDPWELTGLQRGVPQSSGPPAPRASSPTHLRNSNNNASC